MVDTRTDEEAIAEDATRLSVAQHIQTIISAIEGQDNMSEVVTMLNQVGAIICASKERQAGMILNPMMPEVMDYVKAFYEVHGTELTDIN